MKSSGKYYVCLQHGKAKPEQLWCTGIICYGNGSSTKFSESTTFHCNFGTKDNDAFQENLFYQENLAKSDMVALNRTK